jgi:hypothetical protein
MKIIKPCILLSALLLLAESAMGDGFDECLWEKYAEIGSSTGRARDGLAVVYLEPHQLGTMTASAPFADLRVVNDRKEEVPWQIVAKRPEKREGEIPARMINLSVTGKNETWFEVIPDGIGARPNAVEVITPDGDFSRQAQVLGSRDGKTWNTLRKDGVIFDINRGEKLRRTRITFPVSDFSHLAVRIANGDGEPLRIDGVRLLQENDLTGETYTVNGSIVSTETNQARQENSLIVRMDTVFPLDRLRLEASSRNFQRQVQVQIRRGSGDWQRWAEGTVYNFDTPDMKESRMIIEMPDISAREFRLVFRNLDSPPLAITSVNGEGFRRALVFNQQPERKLYLFWGNPRAQHPSYDLGGIVANSSLTGLPLAFLGETHKNSRFAGNSARLPFTERYKYLLSAVVILSIAFLLLLQYRVTRKV